MDADLKATIGRLLDKVTSGRFLLTVICGLTFAYLAATGKFEAAAVAAIISAVFRDYFDRRDRPGPPAGGAPA